LRHAEKKLVHPSLLVLNTHEACIKADVLKQHITPLKPLALMPGLNQIPDSNPNKTNKPTTDSNF
jgi:hypothetical protein